VSLFRTHTTWYIAFAVFFFLCTAVVIGCSVAGIAGFLFAGLCWYRSVQCIHEVVQYKVGTDEAEISLGSMSEVQCSLIAASVPRGGVRSTLGTDAYLFWKESNSVGMN
jgi:hypothetical protein